MYETEIMEKKIDRVRRKKKGFSKLPALDNIYEPEITHEPEPELVPEPEEPEIVSFFIPMPEPEPIIEGLSTKQKKAKAAKSSPATSGLPDGLDVKTLIKAVFADIGLFLKENARYTDVFYDINLGLEAIRKRIEKHINQMAGKKDDTDAFGEFLKEYDPIPNDGIFTENEEKSDSLSDIWAKAHYDFKKSFTDLAKKNNKINAILGKKTKNDSKVIVEVLRFYIMTIIGILMSYNILYTWITQSGKDDIGFIASMANVVMNKISRTSAEMSGTSAETPKIPGMPAGMPGMPGGMPGMPGMPEVPDVPDVFKPVTGVPNKGISLLKTLFKVPGELIPSQLGHTLTYFFIIALFTTTGMVNLAEKSSGGMADSLITISKGKFEGSPWIYIFIVGFWLVDVVQTIINRPQTWLGLIPGAVLSITYLILILVNTLVFASIFKIILLLYIIYRFLFLIPIKRLLQTPAAFAEVYTAATPSLDDETKKKMEPHRNQPISKASFWEYIWTRTFLFENFFSFIFLIVSLVSTSILGKNLQLPFLKSTLPIVMAVMILSFLRYKYAVLFDPEFAPVQEDMIVATVYPEFDPVKKDIIVATEHPEYDPVKKDM